MPVFSVEGQRALQVKPLKMWIDILLTPWGQPSPIYVMCAYESKIRLQGFCRKNLVITFGRLQKLYRRQSIPRANLQLTLGF